MIDPPAAAAAADRDAAADAPASASGPGASWSARRAAVLAALVCAIAYGATLSGHLHSPDEEIQFRTAEGLLEGRWGAVAFVPGEEIAGFATRRGRGGAEFAQYGLGQPIAALPFVMLGAAFDRVLPDDDLGPWFPATTQYHDGSPRAWKRRAGASLFNGAVTAATAGLLAAALVGFGLEGRRALLGALLYGLGTYAWAHARTFFSEPLATLLVFGALVAIAAWHRRGCAGLALPSWAGLLAGFGFMVRKDTPFFYPGLVLFAAAPLWLGAVVGRARAAACLPGARGRDVLAGTGALLGGLVAFMAIHVALSRWMFGSALAMGYEDQPEGIAFGAPLYSGLYGFLFSYGRGLPWFSPALIPALFAWPALWRRRPDLAAGALLMVVPFFLMMCRWQNWAGGWSWGPRHVYQVHVFAALGFVAFLAGPRRGGAGGEGEAEAARGGVRVSRRGAWWMLAVGLLLAGPAATAAAGASSAMLLLAATVAGGLAAVIGATALVAGGGDGAGRRDPEAAEGAARAASAEAAAWSDRRAVALAFLAVGVAVQLYACSQNFIDFYQLAFRRPDVAPTSRALYTPGEAAGYEVIAPRPDGRQAPPAPLWRTRVPAPINDSIYVPQNTAWYGYAAMWREGFHDLLWLRVAGRASGPTPGPATAIAPPPR